MCHRDRYVAWLPDMKRHNLSTTRRPSSFPPILFDAQKGRSAKKSVKKRSD
jgi:hypothetical protein